MTTKKLDPTGLGSVWNKVFSLVKLLTGDVDVKGKGTLQHQIDELSENLINAIYPIGSIYTSTNNVSPATFLGGTWTPIKDTFLMCAGDTYEAGTSGGSPSATLTAENLAEHVHGLNNHTHSVPAHAHGLNGHTHSIPALSGTAASNGAHSHSYVNYPRASANELAKGESYSRSNAATSQATGSGGAHTHTVTTNASNTGGASGNTANSAALTTGAASGNTGNAGSGKAFSILPPYKTVYVWERTA